MTTPRQPAAGPSAIPLQDPKEGLGPPSAGSVLTELLRLYDWRFELAEREKNQANTIDPVFRAETRRLLNQYGTKKKAAWEAARRVLASDKPPAGPSASLAEALTGKEGLEAPIREAPAPLASLAGPSHPGSLGGEVWAGEIRTTAEALEAATRKPRAAPLKDLSDSALPAGPKDLERAAPPRSPLTTLLAAARRYYNIQDHDTFMSLGMAARRWAAEGAAPQAPSASAVPALPSGARQQETEQQIKDLRALRAADESATRWAHMYNGLYHALEPWLRRRVCFLRKEIARGEQMLATPAENSWQQESWDVTAGGWRKALPEYRAERAAIDRALLGSAATEAQPPPSPSGALAGAEEMTTKDTDNTQRAGETPAPQSEKE